MNNIPYRVRKSAEKLTTLYFRVDINVNLFMRSFEYCPTISTQKPIAFMSEFHSTKNVNYIINLHLNKKIKLGFFINL